MTEKRKVGRPSGTKVLGTDKATEQRATFIIRKDLLHKIKLIANAESLRIFNENNQVTTVKLKVVLNNAVEEYIRSYEEKYGELKWSVLLIGFRALQLLQGFFIVKKNCIHLINNIIILPPNEEIN